MTNSLIPPDQSPIQSDTFGSQGSSKKSLRRRAEQHLQALEDPYLKETEDLSAETMRVMLHELRVHQLELEMQNDELRRVQAELEVSRARYIDLYDMAPVGYCIVSAEGLIVQINLNVVTLLGVSRQTLIGQKFSNYIFKSDQDTYYLCRRRLLASGKEQTCQLRIIGHDGIRRWLQIRVGVESSSDEAQNIRMVLTDISVIKRLELKLNSAALLSDKANDAKSKFLANVSHELRTPLTAILGFAWMMKESMPPPLPAEEHSINQILDAGWHLFRLIDGLLDLAQIETGKLAFSMQAVVLLDLLDECISMVGPQAKKRQIRLWISQPMTTHIVMMDRTKMKQVFINLLSNGIKYNRAGGTLEVFFTDSGDGRIRVNIKDAGQGLSKPQLSALFQPFNRLGQHDEETPGTGLGLVLTKHLVERMGGTLGVRSTVGTGSIFWVELKLAPRPTETNPEHR